MKHVKLFIGFLTIICLFSCSKSNNESKNETNENEETVNPIPNLDPQKDLVPTEYIPKNGSTILISESSIIRIPIEVKFSKKVRPISLTAEEILKRSHKVFKANIGFQVAAMVGTEFKEYEQNESHLGQVYNRNGNLEKTTLTINKQDSTKVTFYILYSLKNSYAHTKDGLVSFKVPAGILEYQQDNKFVKNKEINVNYYLNIRRSRTPKMNIVNNYMKKNNTHILVELNGNYNTQNSIIKVIDPLNNNEIASYNLKDKKIKVKKIEKWKKEISLFQSKKEYTQIVTQIEIPKEDYNGKYILKFEKGVTIDSENYSFIDSEKEYKQNNIFNKEVMPNQQLLYVDVEEEVVSYTLFPSEDYKELEGKTLAGRFDNFLIKLSEPILEEGEISLTETTFSGTVKYKISDLIKKKLYNLERNIITIPLNEFRNNKTAKAIEIKFTGVTDYGKNTIKNATRNLKFSNGQEIKQKYDASTENFQKLENKTVDGIKYNVYRYTFNFVLSKKCKNIFANTNSSIVCISDWFKCADFFMINKTKVNNKKGTFINHSGLNINMWRLDENYIDLYTREELPNQTKAINLTFNVLCTDINNPNIAINPF